MIDGHPTRSDAPLVRHIARTHSAEVARDWQAPPLLLLPVPATEDLLRHAGERGARLDLEHLAWEDVVLDVGAARDLLPVVDDEDGKILRRYRDRPGLVGAVSRAHDAINGQGYGRGESWVRVRTLARALELGIERTCPWLRRVADDTRAQTADPESLLLVETWDSRTVAPTALRDPGEADRIAHEYATGRRAAGFPLWPDVALVDRETLRQRHVYTGPCRDRVYGTAWCHLGVCTKTDPDVNCVAGLGVVGQAVRLATAVLSVFSDPPVYLVERRRLPRKDRPRDLARAQKTAEKKPWLREDLSTVVLVDPSRLEDVGHPSTREHGEREDRGPPRLHTRRGHWRRLPTEENPDRKTWVRPAWVGEEAWEAWGSHYQLATLPTAAAVARATR